MDGIAAISGAGLNGIGALWRPNWYSGSVRVNGPSLPELPVQPAPAVKPVSRELPAILPSSGRAALPTAEALNDPAELLARMRIDYPEGKAFDPERFWEGNRDAEENKSPAETAEDGKCETCERRRYQDGSDDPGVSYKLPTRLSRSEAESAVRAHEHEHVVRERAEAEREGRRVVSQSVVIHTGICPECGRTYVSGGETKTVTAEDDGGGAAGVPVSPEAA